MREEGDNGKSNFFMCWLTVADKDDDDVWRWWREMETFIFFFVASSSFSLSIWFNHWSWSFAGVAQHSSLITFFLLLHSVKVTTNDDKTTGNFFLYFTLRRSEEENSDSSSESERARPNCTAHDEKTWQKRTVKSHGQSLILLNSHVVYIYLKKSWSSRVVPGQTEIKLLSPLTLTGRISTSDDKTTTERRRFKTGFLRLWDVALFIQLQ